MRNHLILALLACSFLAGCSSGGSSGTDSDDDGKAIGTPEEVEATDTTGGIRGIVVDDAIRPIADAAVRITGAGADETATTDEGGTFTLSGLEPGTYFIEATHPLYDKQQTTADVEAGVSDPEPIRIQLTRLITEEPYSYTTKYEGFIVCSANAVLPVVGGLLSEECGEGVGVPGVGRVGGQDGNNVQYDFYVDGPGINTLVVEMVWDATSEAGKALYTPVSLGWVCDPFCSGTATLGTLEGTSPLYTAIGPDVLGGHNLTNEERISTFTWASPDTTPVGVTLNQDYEVFVTHFYYLPPPAGWSFVNGDPEPF